MAGLPENWEWDYDGKRWFYRYKPTGLIQYTFPKPGDEFPEFIDDTADTPDLAPEEKLVSQQQIKRRSTLGESHAKQKPTTTQRDRTSSNVVSDPDDNGTPFWLQPDSLMYMGPGAYNDISPLQEEEEEERGQSDGTSNEKKDVPGEPATPPTTIAAAAAAPAAPVTAATTAPKASPNESSAEPARSQASPATSANNTPPVTNSLPVTATPELDSAPVFTTTEQKPAESVVQPTQPPEVPLLDSREVPYDPTGFVAELASESTAKCDDEINPAPVELPSNDIVLDNSEPASYVNAFHLAPVELPSDEIRPARTVEGSAAETKALSPQMPYRVEQEQQQNPQNAGQNLLNRSYKPVRQNSMPQTTTTQSLNPAPTSISGKYQPYNPAKHAVLGAAAVTRLPGIERQTSPSVGDNKRHSLSGPILSQFKLSDAPPAMYPSPLRPSDPPNQGGQSTAPVPSTGPRSLGGLAHVPSVLQPARGRPVIRAQTPSQSQRASPAPSYQVYKPSRDLQREIEDTVQLLSKTGYGQEPANQEASSLARPQVSRENTLPAQPPALPFTEARPHLPHSAMSEPVTLQSISSQKAAPGEHIDPVSSAGTGIRVPVEYSAPLPPSSSDVPPPLKLSRKSPSPGNSPPTIASPPKIANSAVAAHAADGTGGRSEKFVATAQAGVPAAGVQPYLQTLPGAGQHGNPATAIPQTSPGQVVSSGFSVAVDPTVRPELPAAASSEPAILQSGPNNLRAPTTSFSVDAAHFPSVAADTSIAQVHHHIPPSTSVPTDQNATGNALQLSTISPAPPVVSAHSSSDASSGLGVQQAVAPPEPTAIPQPPGPRTPSPVSRAASPPTHSNVSEGLPSVPPLANANSPPNSVIVAPAPEDRNESQSPRPTSNSEEYSIPPGHHPLASHPVNLARPSPPTPEPSNATEATHAVSPENSVAQSNVGTAQTAAIPNQQIQTGTIKTHSQPLPTSPAPTQHFATTSSPSIQTLGQKTAQANGPQIPISFEHKQQPMHAAGQTPPTQPIQGQPISMPLSSTQASQPMPVRTFSHPGVSQPGLPFHPGAPGTAPPQMPVVFPPPTTAPGMPIQHRYPFQPGTPLQPGMQHHPAPPHMMQPSQTMPSGQYVMQHTQPAPPAKEEKSWFGRLWRSDSVKKQTPANPASRMQKAPTQHQVPPAFPPQLQPNQPAAAPQFAPQTTAMAPPTSMIQTGQQAQQVANMQQQPQQQQLQQQQPLTWKINTSGNPSPHFQLPPGNPNSTQPLMPPPEVMESIKKQEMRLHSPGQTQNTGSSQSQGQAPLSGASHQGASSRRVGQEANNTPAPAGGGHGNGAKAGGWEKTKNGISSSGYDGSGWGDDDDEGY